MPAEAGSQGSPKIHTGTTNTAQVSPPSPGEAEAVSPSHRVGPRAGALQYENVKSEPPPRQIPPSKGPTATPNPPLPSESEKVEQFQIPGSLVVTIHEYSGTMPKWALMVILDDSASMVRRIKAWGSSRFDTAVNFIAKLPDILPPGSKLAIRDFLCPKGEENKKSKITSCPARMLYPWTEAPFSALKEKLGQADGAGTTNPCADAVYSMKQDFSSLDGFTPRILMVTDGTGKCSVEQVIKAIDTRGEKERIGLDVVAVGMHQKRMATFGKLAKSANGFFFSVDKPADVESAVARYGKILKTPVMEKIEVRGQKGLVVHVAPDQEITLTAGVYTVVLPLVAGIKPSLRVVDNIKINPGETTHLDVRVKKGRLMTKVSKKP